MVAGFWMFVIVAVILAEHGWGAILAGLAAGLLAWIVEANIWPEITCWWPWCKGGRVSYSWFSHAWRPCFVCGGRGRRWRAWTRSG